MSELLTDFVIYTHYQTKKKSEAINPSTPPLSSGFEMVFRSYKEFDALIPHRFGAIKLGQD